MKHKKITHSKTEEEIFHSLFEEVFEMIAWDCSLPESGLIRDALSKVVALRLMDVFRSELGGFTVRLAHQIAHDLHLPQHVNLYGNTRYIPNDAKGQTELIATWTQQLQKVRMKRKSS